MDTKLTTGADQKDDDCEMKCNFGRGVEWKGLGHGCETFREMATGAVDPPIHIIHRRTPARRGNSTVVIRYLTNIMHRYSSGENFNQSKAVHQQTWYTDACFLQFFDTVGLAIWPVKIVPDMTYNVFGGMLSLYTTTTTIYTFLSLWPWPWPDDLDIRIWPIYSEEVSASYQT